MKQKEARLLLGVKSTNPKDFQGFKKVPFHLMPWTGVAVEAVQMLDGACKYGRENYRAEPVRASIYFDAAIRHLLDWWHGEDKTPDSLLRHLGGTRASTNIIIDAIAAGKFIDDRAHYNGYATLMDELNAEVSRIAAKHKDKKPRHYSRLDNLADKNKKVVVRKKKSR